MTILAITIYSLLLSWTALQPKPAPETALVEYYATIALRESPYAPFQGVVRLSKREAMARKHYQFVYGEGFRLKSISFRLGNRPVAPNHTANYFFTTSRQEFEYRDQLEIRTFYDRFGHPATQRNASKEVYRLDSLGRYQTLRFEEASGNPIENSWGIGEYRWKVQNDGSIIENRYNLKGKEVALRPGFDFYTIRLCYEPNGLLALMQNIDEAGNLVENSSGVAQDKLHFDNEGRWYGWTVLDGQHQIASGNGPNVAKGINTPNRYGYETAIRYEDVDGTPLKNSYGFWGSNRYYDRFGNYDYTQFVDEQGNPGMHEKAGYSIAEYTYSPDGLFRTNVQLLGLNREPVLHKTRGYAAVRLTYDEQGKLIRTAYLGTNDEAVNRTDNGVSYIVLEYDTTNNPITEKRFDKAGNPIE